jgi:hypothetical protein
VTGGTLTSPSVSVNYYIIRAQAPGRVNAKPSGNVFPNNVMSVIRTSERVSNLVKHYLFNLVLGHLHDKVTGQGNLIQITVVVKVRASDSTLAAIEFKTTIVESVIGHHVTGHLGGIGEVHEMILAQV